MYKTESVLGLIGSILGTVTVVIALIVGTARRYYIQCCHHSLGRSDGRV